MTQYDRPYSIGIPIYEGVDLMDVAAPFEIFNWMGHYWSLDPVAPRHVKVQLVAASMATLKTRDGLILTPDATYNAFGGSKHLDLLWVPGGEPKDLSRMMKDSAYLGFLQEQSPAAEWVTSVCEGALLLASAGLLDGYRATTHWAFIACLKSYPEITVADGFPRFVVDGNRVTGGGISSGLDEAFELAARISSYAIARRVQEVTQYFPKPPFRGDIPQPGKCPLDL